MPSDAVNQALERIKAPEQMELLSNAYAKLFDDPSGDVCFIIIRRSTLEQDLLPIRIYAHSHILAGQCGYYETSEYP
jgi:hypothetical protein